MKPPMTTFKIPAKVSTKMNKEDVFILEEHGLPSIPGGEGFTAFESLDMDDSGRYLLMGRTSHGATLALNLEDHRVVELTPYATTPVFVNTSLKQYIDTFLFFATASPTMRIQPMKTILSVKRLMLSEKAYRASIHQQTSLTPSGTRSPGRSARGTGTNSRRPCS